MKAYVCEGEDGVCEVDLSHLSFDMLDIVMVVGVRKLWELSKCRDILKGRFLLSYFFPSFFFLSVCSDLFDRLITRWILIGLCEFLIG